MRRYLFIIVAVGIVCSVVYLISSLELLPVTEKLLTEFTDHAATKRYQIYFVGGTATTQDVIQIKGSEGKNFRIIADVAGYDTLISTLVISDSLVRLVLNDTGGISNKNDTLIVNLFNGKIRR